jgi:integrase/recombinase XerD
MKTRNNKQLDRSNAFTIVNNIYKKARIRKKGLLILRHTLAMRLTQNNTNLVIIKKILRHSNIATTTIYAKATEKSVVEALKIIG